VQAMSQQAGTAPRELILRTSRGEDDDRNPTAVLHVIDTGPGIDDAAAARIFDPYFTTKSGGTGLGLPTARRIIEAHGGRIELHSEPGRGTDLRLTLPATPPAEHGGGE
ncbi:MAG: ATP-binding protein, partial [Phycisphaerales bacterium JB041]